MLAASSTPRRPRRRGVPRWRLPSVCAVCRGWGSARVCAACWSRFAAPVARCRRCAVALAGGLSSVGICGACLAAPPTFDAALARVDYAHPWNQVVAAFKFHDALDLATSLVDGMHEAASGVAEDERPDLLLPVPLAAARLRERGCNQAWELARRLAQRLDVDADPRLVVRIRETAHQLDLPVGARAGNVRGAFAVEPLRRASVQGRRIAVVDDVMTTGSTAAEIAALLKHAGAAHVAVWVFARTPPPGDD